MKYTRQIIQLSLIFASLGLANCSYLFWHDQTNHQPGVWFSSHAEKYYDIQEEFQSKKTSWVPGDLATDTRNYKTTIMEYSLQGKQVLAKNNILEIPEKIIPESLIVTDSMIVLAQDDGTGQGYLVHLYDRKDKAKKNHHIKPVGSYEHSGIYLSLDHKYLTLVGRIPASATLDAQIYDLKSNIPVLMSELRVALEADGLPSALWWQSEGSNQPMLYIRDIQRVIQIDPKSKEFSKAKSFPRCFYLTQTGSGFSASGTIAIFNHESGKLEFEVDPDTKKYQQSIISDFSQIGKNCP